MIITIIIDWLKKQEKEAAIKAKEDAKKAKEQARLDAKKQQEQARLDAQKARQEAKEAAIKAKEDAKRARQEAKEAAKKAKIEARENAKKARLEAKKAKEQARKDAKSKQPVQSIPSSSQKISAQPSAPLPVVLPKKEVSSPSEIVKKPAEVTSSQMNLQPNPSNTSSKDKSKKDSNLKYYMTFIFLALLIWMVAFLPEIIALSSSMMTVDNLLPRQCNSYDFVSKTLSFRPKASTTYSLIGLPLCNPLTDLLFL